MFSWLSVLTDYCMLAILLLCTMGFPHSSDGKESTCDEEDPSSIPGPGRSAGEGIGYPLQYSWVTLLAQLAKNLPACLQCGRPGINLWVGKIRWRTERLPTPVFWPREFHGLYSPWGHKESNRTKRLSLSGATLKSYRKQPVTIKCHNGMFYILFP